MRKNSVQSGCVSWGACTPLSSWFRHPCGRMCWGKSITFGDLSKAFHSFLRFLSLYKSLQNHFSTLLPCKAQSFFKFSLHNILAFLLNYQTGKTITFWDLSKAFRYFLCFLSLYKSLQIHFNTLLLCKAQAQSFFKFSLTF